MSRKNKVYDFNKMCRTCLSDENELRPLFTTRIVHMLASCISIKVEENDGLPDHVCNFCYQQLSRYYTFKNKAERADVNLRKYVRAQEKKMERNIIAQAVSNANIDMTDDMYKTEDFSDDDTLDLSIRTTRYRQSQRQTRQSKIRANELIESVIGNELNDLNYEQMSAMKLDSSFNQQIFSDGPPPLVPLIPIAPEEIPVFPANNIIVEEPLKPISNETPPLIPIKPLSAIDPLTLVSTLETSVQQSLQFLCGSCDEKFTDPIALKNHMTTHANLNSSNLTCNICKKEFADRKKLIGHLKGHMVQKHYACKLCGKRYPNPSTFKVHMRTHTGERPFKCQICNKGFIRWAGVVGHMKSHNSSTPYKCEECGKGFKIPSNLERHKILHTGSMPFCCSYCGKTFSQGENLQLHIRTYHTHERPYLCSECGKGFVSSTRLNRHMWVHTGYKPYACKTCNKAYSNSNDLKNHERTHTGGIRESEKPYACMACDMRFLHPCRLAKHMKTHERPYSCMECMKTFSREDVLHKHIMSKHGNLDTQIQMHQEDNLYTLTTF